MVTPTAEETRRASTAERIKNIRRDITRLAKALDSEESRFTSRTYLESVQIRLKRLGEIHNLS